MDLLIVIRATSLDVTSTDNKRLLYLYILVNSIKIAKEIINMWVAADIIIVIKIQNNIFYTYRDKYKGRSWR